jgi:hypothetical protein
MKCKYCENEATVKDYRTWDGQTGKELVCADCFNITNEALLEKERKIQKYIKDWLIYDDNTVEEVVEKSWGEFWDIANLEVQELEEDITQGFESEFGHEMHNDTIEPWRDEFFERVSKKLKKSI